MAYRYDQLTDIGLKNCIVRAFDDYYPREKMAEGSFNPTKFLVVTWTVTQSILSSGGNEISDSNSPVSIIFLHFVFFIFVFFIFVFFIFVFFSLTFSNWFMHMRANVH